MDETRAPGQFGRWALPGLWLGTFALYLAGVGDVPLWDRDEPRYAQSTVQMLRRGDFIVPYYLTYDVSGDPDKPDPRFHKPPVIYWVQAASCSVFGLNEFGWRFPSAVFGATAVLLVALIGRALFDARVGFWAGAILAASPLMQAMCKMCLCDAPLAAFIVAALWLLARQMRWGDTRGAAAGMWACLGFALLTKGPVTLLYYLSPVAFLAIGGGAEIRARLARCMSPVRLSAGSPLVLRWSVHGLTGPLIMLAIVAAWVIPVQIASWNFVNQDGDPATFLDVSMGTHVISRALKPSENHGGPPGYYVVLVLVTFFPWSLLLPFALPAGLRRTGAAPAGKPPSAPDSSAAAAPPTAAEPWVRLFLLGWTVFPWVFLEFHATKLPHYFLPALPALALLVSRFVFAEGSAAGYWAAGGRRFALGAVTVLIIGAGLAGVLAAAAVTGGWDIPARLPIDPDSKVGRQVAEIWQALSGMAPELFVWTVVLAAAPAAFMWRAERTFRAGRVGEGLGLQVAALVIGGLLCGVQVLPRMTPLQVSRRASDWIAANVPAKGDIVLIGYANDDLRANYEEPSLVVYLGGRARIADTREAADDLLSRRSSVALAADMKYWRELQARRPGLPEPSVVIEGFNYVKGRAVKLGIVAIRK